MKILPLHIVTQNTHFSGSLRHFGSIDLYHFLYMCPLSPMPTMPPTHPDPTHPPVTYLYKLLLPSELPSTFLALETPSSILLPATPLDARDGYIHLSTALQTSLTAARFFSSASTLELWALRIPLAGTLAERVRWDAVGHEGEPVQWFAHVYGSAVKRGEVESGIRLEKVKDKWVFPEAFLECTFPSRNPEI